MDSPKDGLGSSLHDSAAVELTGKIMVVAIIVLFLVVVFVLFLHLYAKWFWWRVEETTVPRRRRFVFTPGQDQAAASIRTGLDPSVLRSLQVLIFNPEDFKDGLECAVCLAELAQGEKARLLPKCCHGFHVECIDMWFRSHSTCPICRNPVAPDSDSAGEDLSLQENSNSSSSLSNEYSSESLNFPTNVLFWGNETQVSTRGACLEPSSSSQTTTSTNPRPDGMLVIDIPRPASDNLSPEEELKSPMTMRLRSLKRLLSKGKRVSPCSSSCVDAEQLGRCQNS